MTMVGEGPRNSQLSALSPPLVVAKVGGSLLDWPALPAALTAWLALQTTAVVLVAGGGEWVESIRDADRRFELGEWRSHRLAVLAMKVTARLLADLLVKPEVVGDLTTIRGKAASGRPVVFDPSDILVEACERDATSPPPCHLQNLPRTWEVTSDSIAAAAALDLEATKLVLLKSRDAPAGAEETKAGGHIDAYLPRLMAAHPLRVQWINLRESVLK